MNIDLKDGKLSNSLSRLAKFLFFRMWDFTPDFKDFREYYC